MCEDLIVKITEENFESIKHIDENGIKSTKTLEKEKIRSLQK